ncbi:oligosaccharide flippase family protein [Agromyces lapidis]|uniref:Oligosaccharide flippase family protein n=1 Tax=Agromyces lapidis TaxID=279574 RepID=A0ABV5SM44_9MICO|nr:oligosaccharide flippase family protein [Agromyces lapidis]
MTDPAEGELESAIGRGLAWSLVNTATARLGSFLTGIVLARIIAPEAFGVYAVALVALNVLLSANELGVSVALVRHPGNVDRIAPTVATLSMASSLVLFLGALLVAGPFAAALGAPEATGVVQVMSVAVLLDGIAAVPNAMLTRAFAQRVRLRIDLIAFAVSTPVTIGLALAGFGVWSLAWGAVVGNATAALLALVWTPKRYGLGFDRAVAAEVLRFGLPLAGSSLLLLVLVNVDFAVVGRVLGTEELGFYFMAFNLAAWPLMLVSSIVRRITTASYARMSDRGDGGETFRASLRLVMGVAVLLCTLLAVYAPAIVVFLYGERWRPAAAAIPALVVLSLGRIIVELSYDFLSAIGRTIGTMWLHAAWLVVLVPALWLGAELLGIRGVAVAHAVVVVAVVLPGVGIVLRRSGVPILPLLRDLLLPVTGAAAVAVTAWLLTSTLEEGFLLLAVGGVVGGLAYAAIVGPWWLRTGRTFAGRPAGPPRARPPRSRRARSGR